METAKAIHPDFYEMIGQLCRKFDLHSVYLFGSRVEEIINWLVSPSRELQSSLSDIDLGVRPLNARPMDVREKVTLTQALEGLFQEQRVDLVLLNEADPFLAVNIIRGQRLYSVDDYAADEYELYLLRRAADLAPFERARLAKLLNPTS